MKLYLCARWGRRDELKEYAADANRAGCSVVSRWLYAPDDGGSQDPAEMHRWATRDRDEVWECDALVAFTEAPRVRNRPPEGLAEEWRPVPGSSLGYEVSSFGRVRNGDGEMIGGMFDRKGYRRVLPSGKRGRYAWVHRLVAEAFLGPRPPGMEIDHKDADKRNNWAGNLEYVTHAENIRRAEAFGLRGSRAGTRNGRAKLKPADVESVRSRLASGESKASIARSLDVSEALIYKIGKGELWRPLMAQLHSPDVEWGLAVAFRKKLVIVGPPEIIFHALAHRQFPAWDAALEYLRPKSEYQEPWFFGNIDAEGKKALETGGA